MLLVNVIKFQGWMYYSVTKTTTKKCYKTLFEVLEAPRKTKKKEPESSRAQEITKNLLAKPFKKKEVPQKRQKEMALKAQVWRIPYKRVQKP